MSFLDSLTELGGDLTGSVTDLGGKYLDLRIEKERAKSAVRSAETIQPNLAQPNPVQPIKGINANGETLVQNTNAASRPSLLDNENVVYIGGGVLALVGLALTYKLIK